MLHIRIHNLQKHDIFCDLALTPTDLQLIRECVKLIDHPEERISVTLTNSRPASIALMPDTTIPIVRAV
jgi:hypothetical protein